MDRAGDLLLRELPTIRSESRAVAPDLLDRCAGRATSDSPCHDRRSLRHFDELPAMAGSSICVTQTFLPRITRISTDQILTAVSTGSSPERNRRAKIAKQREGPNPSFLPRITRMRPEPF